MMSFFYQSHPVICIFQNNKNKYYVTVVIKLYNACSSRRAVQLAIAKLIITNLVLLGSRYADACIVEKGYSCPSRKNNSSKIIGLESHMPSIINMILYPLV